tara:strand:+ start:1938 stop:3575 length:1638 start_codon:yes stop_codon:yes gene_type:complete
MKLLLENWRKYSLLTEQQLLIEGRISDTKLKYPELAKNREELDGENILDVLIDADPSGNQKYLMGAARILFTAMKDAEKMGDGNKPFWGKAWPEDAPDDIYSPWGLAKNIASSLQKYHDIMPYIRDADALFTDLNKIKTYAELQAIVFAAERKKTQQDQKKKEEEELKRAAKESTEFVAKTPYHLVVRPLSKEASCHWGMGTKWCISATKSQNYFDQYTREGAAFFFLLAKRKEIDPAYKKIAVVLDSEGEFEEYFDTEDNNISLQEFITAVSQAITGVPTGDEIASMEESEPYEVETIRKGLEPFKGQRGFDFDADDDINNVAALFRDTFLDSYIDELKEAARTSVEEAPTGVPEEAYEDALRERVFDYVDVTLSFPSETGADFVHWESRLWIDVASIIQDIEGWEVVTDEPDEDDYSSAIEAALSDISIYAESVEAEWGDGAFHVTVEVGDGDLGDFESFLTDAEWTDRQFSGEFQESLIEQLEERGLIINPEKAAAEKAEKEEAARQKTRDAEYWPDREEKKKQLDLPLQENRIRLKIIKNR